MAGGLGEYITLFASWYCGSQTFQKTSVFFGSYFTNPLKQKALPARRAGTKQGGQSVLNDLFYVIGCHIIKPLTFLELVLLLNPTVPCLGLFFPSSPPPLFSVNRLSIRLSPRILFKLRKLLTASIFRYPVRRGPEESKEENYYGEIQVRDWLIRSVSFGGGLYLHLTFSRWLGNWLSI